MADILCGYTADRDETLVAYLYGEIEDVQRAAFEAHLATCERCRREVAELGELRRQLQQWNPPALDRRAPARGAPLGGAPVLRGRSWSWRDAPVWAQVAAASLVAGIAAGVANLDVRVDRGGVTVRTGWTRSSRSGAPALAADTATAPQAARPVAPERPAAASSANALRGAPWTADLAALERRLRAELAAGPAGQAVPARAARADQRSADAELLKQVRALVDDSERRQRNELALRIAQVVQEFDMKRGTDLANIRTLRTVQSATGAEIARQQQWLDLLTRASMQR